MPPPQKRPLRRRETEPSGFIRLPRMWKGKACRRMGMRSNVGNSYSSCNSNRNSRREVPALADSNPVAVVFNPVNGDKEDRAVNAAVVLAVPVVKPVKLVPRGNDP